MFACYHVHAVVLFSYSASSSLHTDPAAGESNPAHPVRVSHSEKQSCSGIVPSFRALFWLLQYLALANESPLDRRNQSTCCTNPTLPGTTNT